MSKPQIKGRAKEIYILSKEKPTAYSIHKQLNKEGLEVSDVSIGKWIKNSNWEKIREEKVRKSLEKIVNKASTIESNEALKSTKVIDSTIKELQEALLIAKKAKKTGSTAQLGNAIANLTGKKELVEGRVTERQSGPSIVVMLNTEKKDRIFPRVNQDDTQ